MVEFGLFMSLITSNIGYKKNNMCQLPIQPAQRNNRLTLTHSLCKRLVNPSPTIN